MRIEIKDSMKFIESFFYKKRAIKSKKIKGCSNFMNQNCKKLLQNK